MGLILPALQSWLGMPLYAMYACGVWATVCFIYSGSCLVRADLTKPQWLRGIMMMNTAYCGFTLILIGSHLHSLTNLGLVYFLAEIPVILGLVLWERHVYRTNYTSRT